MQFKKYIPDFLLPTDEPQAPVRIYDVPLRRGLFQKAQPGNEETITASRNNSVVDQLSAAQPEQRRSSWHPGMAFGH
ncbi:hypothetical protein LTR84_007870 [Exophiala bonariae]|uniref:Uncharacterized protein n=1 Tax=Exophiala bonariae TaxID=1690606 RepID=A0AAV9NM92_9EURO|nr:hypothetical protein LTR84_007870 [Exophiala bonariae]